MRMIRMKGNEKLVKKAVAPAMRNGSFRFNSKNAFLNLCQFASTFPMNALLLSFCSSTHDFPFVSPVCPQMYDLVGIFQRKSIFGMPVLSFCGPLGDPIARISRFDAGGQCV